MRFLALKTTPDAKQLNALLFATMLIVSSAVFLGEFAPTTHGQTPALVTVDPPVIADTTITSGTVTFNIDIANSAPINGFSISILYNRAVLSLSPNGLSFQQNVLAQTGGTLLIATECIDGSSISGNCIPLVDDVGVVSLGLFVAQNLTPNPTNGLLFSLTFNVVGSGVSQIHFLRSLLLNGSLADTVVPSQTVAGYFSNRMCGGSICQPPTVQFTFTPAKPETGVTATFDASSSLATNPGATLQVYVWNWRDQSFPPQPSVTTNPIIQHTYQFSGNYTVTLGLNDTYGVVGYATSIVNVTVFPDFAITPPAFPPLGVGDSATVPLILTSIHGFS